MKISIRIKFFIILLAFSLGPLVISRAIMGKEAGKLAGKISDGTRTELLDIISAELEYNAIALRQILELGGQTMAISARTLALQAEHHLLWEKSTGQTRTYFASNFSHGRDAPPDLAPSEEYQKRTMGGTSQPMPISLDHAAFRLPHKTTAAKAGEDMQLLSAVLPTLKELYRERAGNSQWFNIGLESGVFMTYPGHGSFPMRYDHREQDWYRRTRHTTNEVSWTTPEVDPTTRHAVATASYPIRDDEGNFLGAASIDVPISNLITSAKLKSRWSDEIMSFMVVRYPGDVVANDGLLIIAQESYDKGGRRHWMSGIDPEWMTSDDPKKFSELVVAMKHSTNGIMRLPYKGRDCVWAYASSPDFSFLLIAPETVITELPDQVANSVNSLFDEIRNISAILSGVMLIITGLIAWFGSQAVTKPMIVMGNAAKRLATGDFSARIDMKTGDERDQLIDSFNDMVPKLQERMQMRRDMRLAQEVQRLLLPRTEPTLAGFDISGGIAYCEQTGGDYYDFIDVASAEGKALGVVVGDVSGHGVPSALLMATARGQLHSLSKILLTPRERIAAINAFLCRDMDGTGRFLTLFYLRLLEGSATIRWVRAGHDPAIRYTPETGQFSQLDGDGLALGVVEDFEFQDYETTLLPGEVLVIATDGVWEARNLIGEMFGKQRMLAIIKENAHKSSEGIRLALMKAVEVFEGNGQEDDIAVVVIKKD